MDCAKKRRDDGGLCCGIWSVFACGMRSDVVLGNPTFDDDANVPRKARMANARSDILASVYYTDG
eukprot:scaffold105990_cov50-Attheya_sp.AAC.2